MPLSNFSAGELSSRHLPDVSEACSNTSFSFQIPGASNTLLADEDPDDFFRAVGTPDLSIAVAGSSMPQIASEVLLDEMPLSKDTQNFLERDSSILKDDTEVLQESNVMQGTLSNLSDGSLAITSYDKPISAADSGPVIVASSLSGVSVFPNPTRSVPLVADHASGVSVPMTTQSTRDNLRNRESQPIATRERVQRSNIKEIAANKSKKEGRTEHAESEGQRKRGLRKEQKTIELGVTKSRITRSLITRGVSGVAVDSTLTANALPPMSKIKDSNLVAEGEDLSLDMSSTSMFPIGGVAARLMQYGRNYMETFSEPLVIQNSTNEFIQPKKSEENANTDTVMEHPRTETKKVNQDVGISEDDRDQPLTLSQLSPRKGTTVQNNPLPSSRTANLDVLPSAIRPSNKRPMTLDPASEGPQKKKPKHPEFKAEVPKKEASAKPRLPSSRLQTRTAKPRSNSGSALKAVSSSRSGPKLPTRETREAKRIVSQPSVFNPGTGWNDNVQLLEEKDVSRSHSNSKSTSSSNAHSRIGSGKGKEENIPSSSSSNNQAVMSKSDAENCAAEEPQNDEAHSRSGSRSQSSRSQKHKFYHPAPDFKAMHIAFDASLAQRKENIRPVVPLSIQLETDKRMQERKKFDERIKGKLKEEEEEEEKRRKIRQEEEERDLKELRKKLVIKAHEVPEWYKTVPKTKKQEQVDSVEN